LSVLFSCLRVLRGSVVNFCQQETQVVSEFGFLLSALSVTSRLCVKNVVSFSQRRKKDPKPQSKLRHYFHSGRRARLALILSAVLGPIPSTISRPPPPTNFRKSSNQLILNFCLRMAAACGQMLGSSV